MLHKTFYLVRIKTVALEKTNSNEEIFEFMMLICLHYNYKYYKFIPNNTCTVFWLFGGEESGNKSTYNFTKRVQEVRTLAEQCEIYRKNSGFSLLKKLCN